MDVEVLGASKGGQPLDIAHCAQLTMMAGRDDNDRAACGHFDIRIFQRCRSVCVDKSSARMAQCSCAVAKVPNGHPDSQWRTSGGDLSQSRSAHGKHSCAAFWAHDSRRCFYRSGTSNRPIQLQVHRRRIASDGLVGQYCRFWMLCRRCRSLSGTYRFYAASTTLFSKRRQCRDCPS